MHPTSLQFKQNARQALADDPLQAALAKLAVGFPVRRAEAAARMPEFESLRDSARDIKTHVLENLDYYLEAYEKKVIDAGGHVHWCRDAEEARQTILEICRKADAKTVTKSK